MPMPNETKPGQSGRAVLEVATRDPMAAVRHVAALLARRAYPLLALACLPAGGDCGRLVLAVADDGRTERLAVELAGLPEVVAARLGPASSPELAALLGEPATA